MKHFIYYLFGLSLLLLSFDSNAQESSNNNSCSSAQFVPAYQGGGTYFVTIDASLTWNDNDYFRFTWNGTTYVARVKGYAANSTGEYDIRFTLSSSTIKIETLPDNGSTTDTYLYLYTSNCGAVLEEDDDDGIGYFSKITYTIPTPPTSTCSSDRYEPDNTACTATYGGNYSGYSNGGFLKTNYCISPAQPGTWGDSDYTRFIVAGQTYYFIVTGNESGDIGQYSVRLDVNPSTGNLTIETLSYNGSSTDTYLYLFRQNGACTNFKTLVTGDDNGGVGDFSKIVYPLSSLLVSNDLEDRSTSALEEHQSLSIKVFPNPASKGEFTLEFNQELEQVSGGLYDLSGKLIKQFAIENAFDYKMDVSGLPAGMYILRAESEASIFTEKVVIK